MKINPCELKFEIKRVTKQDIWYDLQKVHVVWCEHADLNVLDAEIVKWASNVPVVISAPTGVGKTTYICNNLLPKVYNCGRKLLLLVNRKALSEQTIERLVRNIIKNYMPDKDYNKLRREIERDLDDGNIGICDLGPVILTTVQAFTKAGENYTGFDDVGVVVVDEAHYFKADAIFNVRTAAGFDKIFTEFPNAIKIFVTATPQNILPDIIEKGFANNIEETWTAYGRYVPGVYHIDGRNPGQVLNDGGVSYYNKSVVMYIFPDIGKNYKFIALKDMGDYSKTIAPLVDDIKNDKEGKAVLFIDNKQVCSEIAKQFEGNSVFINAETKYAGINDNNYVAYKRLLLNEKFDAKVLITTSVLDNGVNINDTTLKRIFIGTDDSVKFMQMLGRLRFPRDKNKNYQVEVYFIDYGKEHFEQRRKRYKEMLAGIAEYLALDGKTERVDYFNKCRKQNLAASSLLELDVTGDIIYNRFAISELRRLINYYDNVASAMTGERKENSENVFDFSKFLLVHYQDKLNKKFRMRVDGKALTVPFSEEDINLISPREETEDYNKFKNSVVSMVVGKGAYSDIVATWFSRKFPICGALDFEGAKLELIKYLKKCLEKGSLADKELDEFKETINKLIANIMGERKEYKQPANINKFLNRMGIKYQVKSKQGGKDVGRKSLWYVTRT